MYIKVGSITNSHGIRGSVKVYPHTYDVERFNEYEKLFIGVEKIKVHIKEVSFYKNLVILTFEEFDDINQILKFKDQGLFILEEDRKDLDEDIFYLDEIINSKVVDLDNNYLGEVVEIINNAANDIYVIKKDGKNYYIPAVKEFIKNVDVDNKTITINPIKGMFDEN